MLFTMVKINISRSNDNETMKNLQYNNDFTLTCVGCKNQAFELYYKTHLVKSNLGYMVDAQWIGFLPWRFYH